MFSFFFNLLLSSSFCIVTFCSKHSRITFKTEAVRAETQQSHLKDNRARVWQWIHVMFASLWLIYNSVWANRELTGKSQNLLADVQPKPDLWLAVEGGVEGG